MKYALLLIFLLTSFTAQAMQTRMMSIKRADGSYANFKVERAITDQTRADGLMFRKSLDAGKGMIFIYESPKRLSFWMKNTLIPLDMIFFNEAGEVVFIERNATPKTLDPRGPTRADICAVLEIAGGEAKKQRLNTGDRLVLEGPSACLP